ncbi:MAG: hypothetical protein HUU30_13355, partial [Burkholderiaceae bacterium]|nr:hypothetical protein [Burkholderiaceae bacterium]
MIQTDPALLWAPQAWVQGRWRQGVCLRTDASGRWAEVTPDQPPPPTAQ